LITLTLTVTLILTLTLTLTLAIQNNTASSSSSRPGRIHLPKSEEKIQEEDLPFAQTLGCSALAGAVASAVTNPLDLAKLRLQIERRSIAVEEEKGGLKGRKGPTQAGLYHIMKKVYLQEGIKGLFRGAGARVLFHTPSTAITMTMFELCRKKWSQLLSYE
jgi:hypothetical protein